MTAESAPRSGKCGAGERETGERGAVAPRWMIRAITRAHLWVHRLSGGRLLNSIAGDEVCFVTTTGAKSGRPYTVVLMYVPFRSGCLLVGSQGGASTNPAWYYNLVTHPDVLVMHRGRSVKLRARIAGDDEKRELWPVCDQLCARYADYRARTRRDIPIFICERDTTTTAAKFDSCRPDRGTAGSGSGAN